MSSLMEEMLVGRTLIEFERLDHSWALGFSDGVSMTVSCLWRILADGQVVLTSEDDGHKFGLPAPVDAEAQAREHLVGKPVASLLPVVANSDLSMAIGSKTLQLVVDSSGYEAWVTEGLGRTIVGRSD